MHQSPLKQSSGRRERYADDEFEQAQPGRRQQPRGGSPKARKSQSRDDAEWREPRWGRNPR